MTPKQVHIFQNYDQELRVVREHVLEMGELVKVQFQNATRALIKGDKKSVVDVIAVSDVVNNMELQIDEECATLIALRQPAAVDLRTIFTVIKVVTDLERIGDESEKIAQFAGELREDAKTMNFYKNLKNMVNIARENLERSLSAYATLDVAEALAGANEMDNELDEQFELLNRAFVSYLYEDHKHIESMIKATWCARAIERVGDHAKNICEYVVFVVKGKDIRHDH